MFHHIAQNSTPVQLSDIVYVRTLHIEHGEILPPSDLE